MNVPWLILPIFSALATIAGAQEKVNPDSQLVEDFSKRVAEYVKLHKIARSQVRGLKPTNSPEAIQHHEHELAEHIRESRQGVRQGNIFTPGISAEFRRLLGIAMSGPDAGRIHESLKHAEPVRPRPLRVNGAYPSATPLQSIPPSLLLNLPALPAEIEYRIVGHDLVLRDVEANLVVDFIPAALS